MGGRGSCRAETTANGDWRLATGKTAASSEWRVESSRWFFPESTALPCRKISVVWELNWRAALLSSRIVQISVVQEHDPPVKAKTAANGE